MRDVSTSRNHLNGSLSGRSTLAQPVPFGGPVSVATSGTETVTAQVSQARWEAAPPMPTALYAHAAASPANGRLYVFGGILTSGGVNASTYEYDPASATWTTRAALPNPVAWSAAAVVGSQIFVVGGVSSGTRVPDCQMYDPSSNTWSSRAPLPSGGRAEHVCANPGDGTVHAIAGLDDFGSPSNLNERFDPAANVWTVRQGMPGNAQSPAGGSRGDGKVWVAGGYWGGWLTNAFLYDAGTDSWEIVADLPLPLGQAGATVLGGRLHVVGGGNDVHSLSHLEYDPDADVWRVAAHLPLRPRTYCSAVAVGARLHLCGGLDPVESVPTGEMLVYDPRPVTAPVTGIAVWPGGEATPVVKGRSYSWRGSQGHWTLALYESTGTAVFVGVR